ncbi:MAG TPA: hypothetical protein VK972_00215, partial [Wenzhouxiangella sp.]|nr:hypothetical protein [Wenzhouxiangella sp.]
GELADELSEAIAECSKSTEAFNKKSSVTLKLTFEPNQGQALIHDEVTSKPAKPTNPATIAYIDVHGNLSRQDPNQQDLNLRSADIGDDEQAPRTAEDAE